MDNDQLAAPSAVCVTEPNELPVTPKAYRVIDAPLLIGFCREKKSVVAACEESAGFTKTNAKNDA